MTTYKHAKIRFIGYAIPTTPANLVSIGNPNGPGAVAGTYLGSQELNDDIQARVAVLKNAVDEAKALLPKDEGDEVTNLFVAPEFYFHGPQGPYVYNAKSPDPIAHIQELLSATFNNKDYPNWTFIFGSAISAKVENIEALYEENSVSVRNAVVDTLSKQWQAAFGPLKGVVFDMLVNFIKNCHSYPNLEVRNRALLVSNIPLETPKGKVTTNVMTTEKYYVSNEDFLLYEVEGNKKVVTEQMTAYPAIDLSNGDLKQSADDQYAIFRQSYGVNNFPQYVDFGVEICLDHSDVRLRRNIDSEPFPQPEDAVHVQIIPSCGMQIQPASVAADKHGFVFNCDGQYALDKTDAQAEAGEPGGVTSIYANYYAAPESGYQAHTQLARVATPATGNDPNNPSSTNATYEALDHTQVTILPVGEIAALKDHFAGGAGAVHIYGLQKPYELYPGA